jgi:hypothetical protein
MESKNMRIKAIISSVLLLSFFSVISGNSDSLKVKIDRFRIHGDITLSVSSFKLMGVSDISSSSLTIIDNKEVTTEPVYKYQEKRVFGLNPILHVGFNIPFYRTNNWSVGVKVNGGIGYQYGIGAENFSGLFFDFPQYVYYRNYKKDFDFTVFAGYKQTIAPISSGLYLVGLDINLSNRNAIRFYLSPYRRTYYSELTNGDIKPAIRIIEFGVGLVF